MENNCLKISNRKMLNDILEDQTLKEKIKINMSQNQEYYYRDTSRTNREPVTLPISKKQDIQYVKHNSEYPIVMGLNSGEFKNDFCTKILVVISYCLIVIFFPLSLLFTFKKIKEYQRGVKFRLGKLKESSTGPGLVFYLPCIEAELTVDMRTFSFEVPPQEVLTRDSVTVSVDAVVYYRVFNPAVSISNVENADASTRLLAQTTLRNVLGQKSLSEILSDREAVSQAMRECLDEATDPWV
jgi:erythrocyte band 7 integral membrane protein